MAEPCKRGLTVGLTVLLTAVVVLLLYLLVQFIWCKYLKWKVSFWKHKYRRRRNNNRAQSNSYLEDGRTNARRIYVGYCNHDMRFAYENVIKRLEDDYKVTTYMYHRDNVPGGFLGEAISESMDSSDSVLLLCSRKFMSMVWHDFELKVALHNATQYKQNVAILLLPDTGDDGQDGWSYPKHFSNDSNFERMLDINKETSRLIRVPPEEMTTLSDEVLREAVQFLFKTRSTGLLNRQKTVRESIIKPSSVEDQYQVQLTMTCMGCHGTYHLLQLTPSLCPECQQVIDGKSSKRVSTTSLFMRKTRDNTYVTVPARKMDKISDDQEGHEAEADENPGQGAEEAKSRDETKTCGRTGQNEQEKTLSAAVNDMMIFSVDISDKPQTALDGAHDNTADLAAMGGKGAGTDTSVLRVSRISCDAVNSSRCRSVSVILSDAAYQEQTDIDQLLLALAQSTSEGTSDT